jgi:hypothetical protein
MQTGRALCRKHPAGLWLINVRQEAASLAQHATAVTVRDGASTTLLPNVLPKGIILGSRSDRKFKKCLISLVSAAGLEPATP